MGYKVLVIEQNNSSRREDITWRLYDESGNSIANNCLQKFGDELGVQKDCI